MTLDQIKQLAYHAARGTAPSEFSAESVDKALQEGLKTMCSSLANFMKNRYDLYEIIAENADEIVPAKVIDAIGMFANVKVIGENEKIMFRRMNTLGKARARQFLTKVGLAGVYETFRLDSETYTIDTFAIGGGVSISFVRIIDGADTLASLMEIITEGLVDAVFIEVQKALANAYDSLPANNRHSDNVFIAENMFNICTTVSVYGGGSAVIFAPPEFIGAMGADAIVPIGYSASDGYPTVQGVYHPQDIDRIHNHGYINLFRGYPVVRMPQSFIDTTNTAKWIDPRLAYVLPTGKHKVVDVVIEGKTQMYDHVNRDQSLEIMVYRKFGIAIQTYFNWGIYRNTGVIAGGTYSNDSYPNI